ncbi:MAG: hypothetical protein JWQ96_2159 [Segetibacter sp.]|nr:hypothetical protein [Segetibacter sp.]
MRKMMIAFLLLTAFGLQAQTLSFTDETTDVKFQTKHLAGQLEGTFRGVKGSAQFDPADLAGSSLKLAFDVTTATTNDHTLGPNLFKEECFYTAKFPTIEFSSSRLTQLANNKYLFEGTIQLKGVSKYLSFPFAAKPNAGGYDFNFSFTVLRKAFDLNCGAMAKDFKIIVRGYGKKV